MSNPIFISIPNHKKEEVAKFLRQTNLGQRGKFDGNFDKQFTGLLGEVIVYEVLTAEEYKFKQGYDGGFDFKYRGKRFDVKTMLRVGDVLDFYVHNLTDLQINYPVDAYIFASINKTTQKLQLCGWIDKTHFLKLATKHKAGDKQTRSDGTSFVLETDSWTIEQRDLLDINYLRYLYLDL